LQHQAQRYHKASPPSRTSASVFNVMTVGILSDRDTTLQGWQKSSKSVQVGRLIGVCRQQCVACFHPFGESFTPIIVF
jgi:hypothetical protein